LLNIIQHNAVDDNFVSSARSSTKTDVILNSCSLGYTSHAFRSCAYVTACYVITVGILTCLHTVISWRISIKTFASIVQLTIILRICLSCICYCN